MKALIIGGAGFVGNHLADHLHYECGWSVYSTKLAHESIKTNYAKVVDLDILNKAEIIRVLVGIKPDYIFHLAAQSSVALSWENPGITIDINIKGSLNLLDAVRTLAYKPRVLLVGSGEEYGHIKAGESPIHEANHLRPGNIYAATKACQNMLGKIYVDAYDLDIIMARAFNHIGPGQSQQFVVSDFCKQIAEIEAGNKEAVIEVGNLSVKRDFTDVRDVVRAYALLMERGRKGEIYNVGSGHAVSIQSILDKILKMSNAEIKVYENPDKIRPVDIPIIEAGIEKLKKDTGWNPIITLEDTMKETLIYWRQEIMDLKKYNEWIEKATEDEDLAEELLSIKGNKEEMKDRFYRDLEFGTGGLRGVIGAGTYRMNIYTIGKVTQGYSNYLKKSFKEPTVAIAYDSRIKSELFAKTAAAVFSANGIKVNLYQELMPTPALSFAIRELRCCGGIIITASHNPAKYNGYKVYGADGCQITLEAAQVILSKIEALDIFNDIKRDDFEKALSVGKINYISEGVINRYIDAVSSQGLQLEKIDKDVSIVYTPLNGAGLRCVTTCLKRNGFNHIIIPEEQEQPNGNFPTCPYPNPEIRAALEVGLKKAQDVNSDLLLATDPDCDRVGAAVKTINGYELISGNQMGILLMDYIAKTRQKLGTLPARPVVISTIVSTKMADKVAKDYGIEMKRVLTGFKFIGEQIGLLEAKGEESRYIFGFEESYGYLSGSFVRDKDGVNAALLICEMFAYYKGLNKSLIDVLGELYSKYGVFTEQLQSVTFEGAAGFEKMQNIMKTLRKDSPDEIIGHKVLSMCDYQGDNHSGLPKSNVLEFGLDSDITVIVRPSGTEPKLKIYYSVKSETKEEGKAIIKDLKTYFEQFTGGKK